MANHGTLSIASTQEIILKDVKWCSSFVCKLRGLMFRRSLAAEEGLLLVEVGESRALTSIHMLFMNFPIGVIWLNGSFEVVDTVLARPWRLSYVPARPAQYTLETSPNILNKVQVGDHLIYEAVSN